MKLNSNGKLARFYMWLPPDDKKLPQELCTFFWGLIGRFMFVFVMGGMVLSSVVYACVMALQFAWAHRQGAGLIALSVALAAVLMWLAERKKKIEFFSEAKAIIKGRVDGIKNRYCPRIDWR